MRKKQTNTSKVLQYVQKHPQAPAKEVAIATGVKINTVYQTIYKRKKDMRETMSVSPAILIKASPKKEVKDNVNHPAHYKTGGIETIDFIEAKSLNYNLGNVVKYITRADHKGNKLEDLKKGAWYLLREIKSLEKK